jgi:hypothetical protein
LASLDPSAEPASLEAPSFNCTEDPSIATEPPALISIELLPLKEATAPDLRFRLPTPSRFNASPERMFVLSVLSILISASDLI